MKNPASILVACGAVFLLVAAGASIKSAGADTPQVVSKMGAPAAYGVTVQSDPAHPLSVSATVNVAGAADLPGNTATFNAANVCTAVLTAGLQSVGFHLDSGTLAATLTAYGTQAITAVNCASAGTCTTLTFSSGATIVVTNPNPVKDVSVVAVPGMRQIEVCTSAYSSGSATGVVTGTYLNATSSGGGGGTVTQGPAAASSAPWSMELSDGTSFYTGAKTGQLAASLDASGGAKTHEVGTAAVSGTFWQATQPVSGTFWQATQPVSGTFWQTTQPVSIATAPALVASTATIGNVKITDGTNTAVVKAGSTLPAASDPAIVCTLRDALPGTQSMQGLGSPGSPSGGVLTVQPPSSGSPSMPVTAPNGFNAADQNAATTSLSTACTSTTACLNTASIQWPMNGASSSEVTITGSSSPLGFTSQAVDASYDATGTTYTLAKCVMVRSDATSTGTVKTALVNADLTSTPSSWEIMCPGAPSFVRFRVAGTPTSGSFNAAGHAVFAPGQARTQGAAIALGAPLNAAGSNIGQVMMAVDSSTATTGRMLTASANGLIVASPTAANFKVTATLNDGTNAQTIKAASTPAATTDTSQVVQLSPLAVPVCTTLINISQTATTKIVSGSSGKKIYICAVKLYTETAQSVNLIEGTGTTCATGTQGVDGVSSTTPTTLYLAGQGWNLAASTPFLVAKNATDDLCVAQSSTGHVSGFVSYALQ